MWPKGQEAFTKQDVVRICRWLSYSFDDARLHSREHVFPALGNPLTVLWRDFTNGPVRQCQPRDPSLLDKPTLNVRNGGEVPSIGV
jgi:hypothetical protein